MHYRRILITGGAGFVGSSYAIWLARNHEGLSITAVDNLKRRGSELNLPRLREHGIDFVHADIRNPEDLRLDERQPDLIVDCSAEPSVLAGYGSGAEYVIRTNLTGTGNCLELARRCGSAVLFLSTSRVYPIARLNQIAVTETATRFEIAASQQMAGVSRQGVSEAFSQEGARSLYGATKLASELLLHEYADMYGLPVVINRCGVIAGPWQMGKVDQGVFALWVAAHRFNRPLAYIGWGGEGKQVRDALFIDDLCELLDLQVAHLHEISGSTFNVGGGPDASASLLEMTGMCEIITGNALVMGRSPENRPGDVRLYITDNSRVRSALGWHPSTSVEKTLAAIDKWVCDHQTLVQHLWTS
jgi:CDP-paratose 2-epimerase